MAKFWYLEPINELQQRKGSLEFGLYPACEYWTSTDKMSMAQPYSRVKMNEMLDWCDRNLKSHMVWSNRYGSFSFRDERDRAMFRLFFSDESMPEPTHWPGMENPPKLKSY
jgi:hypothetical protein